MNDTTHTPAATAIERARRELELIRGDLADVEAAAERFHEQFGHLLPEHDLSQVGCKLRSLNDQLAEPASDLLYQSAAEPPADS